MAVRKRSASTLALSNTLKHLNITRLFQTISDYFWLLQTISDFFWTFCDFLEFCFESIKFGVSHFYQLYFFHDKYFQCYCIVKMTTFFLLYALFLQRSGGVKNFFKLSLKPKNVSKVFCCSLPYNTLLCKRR